MTTDQDTPVAASQPATDTSSQEVSKPKRTPTTRKAKAATKPAAGKSTAKSADSAPSQEPQEIKAAQAPAATPKTSASKTATAKGTSRSAGKTTKTAAAKSKKTATATKKISAGAAEATSPASAAATADAASTAAPTAKSTAKTATSRATSRVTAARKPKSAAAQTDGSASQPVSTDSTAAAEAAPKAAASRTAKAPRSRSTAAKGSAKTAGAKAKTEGTAAKPAAEPVAAQPSGSKEAEDKSAKAAGLAAQQTSKPAAAAAPADVAKAAPEKISDKPADRTPRQDATPAAPQTDSQEPRQQAEQTAESSGAPAAGDAPAGDSPRRKNRRGRRGGRGRNRKKDQSAQNTQDGDTQTSADALNGIAADGQPGVLAEDLDDILADDLNDDADSLDLDDDLSDTARESRPRQAPRQGKPQQQAKQPGKQPESGKASDAAKGKGEKAATEAPRGKRRMFISVLPGEQVEVALAEDGQLLEYYLDMLHQRKIKGNIYKGVIHNIDTNLQAAFVSYGAGKNGFLQIDEVHPEYWLAHHEPSKGKKFPPIQKVLKAGQEVLVQVVKEPTGSKGAFLTTWLSLAGRFLVLTPGQDQIGVSRKVDDDDERARLREMMNGIDPGQGLGVIVRTVSAGTTKTTLKNDLQYLKRVWRDIRKKATEVSAPSLIYQEPGLSERAVRDYLTEDVCEIWVDNEDVAQSVRETVNLLFPRRRDLVRLHTDMRTPMWERFNLRRQLEQIYSREVLLPSGGRLVFDQTEALMAIDINSGKISGKGNFEAMAHKTNMEAADAIARHLKLRDIGGQVVIDFIEMRDKKHVLEVEKTLRTAMKNDRARHDVSRMSSFGLLELVRQRTGSSALAISLEPCPACGGTGMRRNIEWQALQALRELRRMMSVEPKEKCVYSASPELALYLLNHKRDTLREIEQDYGKCLEIMVRP